VELPPELSLQNTCKFAAKRECDATRYRWRERVKKADEKGSEESNMTLGEWYMLVNAMCIASNDIRLKAK
jgi:hypothetical protein